MRSRARHQQARLKWILLLLLAPVLLTSCTLRLVATYDVLIDQSATELQEKMDRHLTSLEALGSAEEAHYAANGEFYQEYAVRLRSMKMRASAHEKNEETMSLLVRMEYNLNELRNLHFNEGTLSPTSLNFNRELFGTAWRTIIVWEVAKMRGDN